MHQQQQLSTIGHYLKEYLSFDFAFTRNPKIGWKKSANFQYDNGGSYRLEPVCYDNYTLRPQVYFVQWEDNQTSKNIYIKQEDSEQWCAVELNQLPIWIKIINNCAFLIGARQLIIVPLEKQQTVQSIVLQGGQISDIKYCFDQNAEPGIYIVYFDRKRGYFARTYTKKTTVNYWNRIKPYLQISFGKFEPYQHFQVIIPNILALAFKDQNIFLYDLHSMKEVNMFSTMNQITQNQTFNIKWKQSLPTQEYSDVINVFICRRNIIESFLIRICRKQVIIAVNGQQVQEKVQINRIIAGDVINWDKTSITKAEFTIQTVNNIIDFDINQNQLIYSFFQQHQSYIPTVLIVNLNNPTKHACQVLSLQNKIYANFLQNKFRDRVHLLVEQQKLISNQVITGKKHLQITTRMNRSQNTDSLTFYKFLSVGSKFWSIRRTAFFTYQPVTQLQFIIEKQSEVQNFSLIDLKSIESLSQFRILRIAEKLTNFSFQAQQNHYKDLLYQMKRSTSREFSPISQENISQGYISNTLFKKLVGNVVKDYIQHFNNFAKYYFRVLQMPQVLQQNIAIYKICCFLEEIGFGDQLQKQIKQSLFEYYVDSIWNKLQNKGEFSAGLIFKKIFENILLGQYIKYPQNISQENMFLETMIQLFILYQQNQTVLEYLQKVIKKYLGKLGQMQQSVFHHIITQNSSVFLIFVLSNPDKDSLTSVFRVLYNKKHYQAFKTKLRKIQQFIPNQLQILLQLELDQAPIKSKLNYEHFVQFTQKPLVLGSMIKKPSKSHIVQEMFLYDSEQRYRQNLSIQKYILDQIKTVSPANFKSINNNLTELSQKQLSFDILKRNSQHILEWEENILEAYTQLFNQKVYLIESASQEEINQISEYLTLILAQIQASMLCYCKFYEQTYNKQQIVKSPQSSPLDGIKSKIIKQQSIMTNALLQKPLKIYKFVLSQLAIKILRTQILQANSIKTLRANKLITKGCINQLFHQTLRNLLIKNKLRWQDLDILQYVLMKQGQKKFRELLRKFIPESLTNVVSFLQEKKDQGFLYSLMNNIKNSQDIPMQKYRNPFAVY